MIHDKTCSNCNYWQKFLGVSAEICRLTNSKTKANDTCSQFRPKSTFDGLYKPE